MKVLAMLLTMILVGSGGSYLVLRSLFRKQPSPEQADLVEAALFLFFFVAAVCLIGQTAVEGLP